MLGHLVPVTRYRRPSTPAAFQTAYDSDTVDKYYEAGVKFDLLDNKLLIDATVFNIDWNDIQACLFGPTPNYYSYVVNAASGNIAGVEFAATVRPVCIIAFSTNMTYQDGRLTDFLPDTFAADGGLSLGHAAAGFVGMVGRQ